MKEIELIGKRKAREKHFLKENGIITANVYDEDIHFLKDGKYEEIDNTLVEENGYLVNKNNAYKVYFSKKSKDELMEMSIGNNYIKTRLVCQKEVDIKENITQSKLHKNVCYPDIIDNIDLEYNVMPGKVKEAIILKNKNVDLEKLVFLIETNTKLELKENKKITSTIDNNNCFEFDAPYMVDAKFKTNNNVNYKLTKIDGGIYQLELIIDKEWLNNEEITYPVMIDPTITNSGQNNSVYDTYIYPGDTGVDRNSQDILKVGVEKVNGSDRVNRALIKFDLPTIGTGSQVISASLDLWGYPVIPVSYESDIVTVHQITSDWNESSADWSTMNDRYNSLVEGMIEARRGYYDFENETIQPAYCGCDITRLVRRWYTGAPNYGLLLKLNQERYNEKILPAFYSKNNNGSGGNPKPVLVISYRNQNGILNYMDYLEQSFSDGMAYVNSYNGNLTTIFNIGKTIGGKMPVELELVYNTNDVVLNNNNGYGLGYKFNLHQMIREQQIDGKTYLEYNDEDSTLHYFLNQKTIFDDTGYNTSDTGNIYYDEDGLDMTITKSNNDYVLKDKNGNIMKFIKNGDIAYLSEIQDVNGNKNTITYNSNNLISEIVDANDSKINISYEDNLITIVSPYETVKLNYSNDKIISINSLIGITYFEYNENNIISKITDFTNLKIVYEYYEQKPYKIKKISEYGTENTLGKSYNITYGFDSTTITDSDGAAKNIIFNSQGSIVSISGLKNKDDINNAYGISQQNGTNDGTNPGYNNKLLESEVPLKYVKNLLSNTSFENNNINFYGTDNVNISISNEVSETGTNSLKAVNTSENQILTQGISVTKGEYYTFSAFVKNTNKVKLALSYLDENNVTIESESEIINPSDDFERYDVTIEYPETATSNLILKIYLNSVGTTYVDDVQLEVGEVANNYNLLENSDFSNGFSDWILDAYDPNTGNSVSTNDKFEVVSLNGIKALKIKKNPAYDLSMQKTFNISGKGGDVFNISFWYKNLGILSNLSPDYGSRVYISFNYVDQENGHCGIPSPQFNPNDESWQYVSNKFVAEKDYNSITVVFSHTYDANDVYITNMSLFKDIRSVNYQYDEFGNIIMLNDLNDQTNKFDYNKNNQIVKMFCNNNDLTFEYDNIITDLIINGMSEMGISTKIKYDDNNNPIVTKVKKTGIIGDISDGLYKIRMKGTNKYVRNINGQIEVKNENGLSDLWILEKINDYFKIHHSIVTNKYLTIQDSNLILSSENADYSLFKLEKNKNGSYLIKLKTEDKYLKYNNDSLEIDTLVDDDYNYEFYFECYDSNLFIESNFEYTDDGKFTKSTIDTMLNQTFTEVDSNTGLIKSIINPKGQKTTYEYNDKHQIKSINNGNMKVEYKYNDNNYLSKIIHGNKEYIFSYNEFLKNKSIYIGDNIILCINNYNPNNGKLSSTKFGNNHYVNYKYDSHNRIKNVERMNNIFEYKYNSVGDLTKITSNDYIIKNKYDMGKRLTEYKYNDFKIKYIYDANDNVINTKYILNDIINTKENLVNDNDLLTKMTFDNNILNNNYDSLGRIINSNINNNFNFNYEYLSNGNRTSTLIKNLDINGELYSYTYDKLNNITHIYHNNILEHRYYYDQYNELIKEINYILGQVTLYKYNITGNILYKKVYELNTNNLIEKIKYEYGNISWEDQLTKFDNVNITYDEAGNPLTIGDNIQLNWINGRELNSYIDDNNSIFYKYNHDGLRISKTVNSIETKYYLEGNNIVYEITNNNNLYYIRDLDNDLVGFLYNNTIYFYIKNMQDDIIGILDGNYNIVAKYSYDSWGNILSITDNDGNDVSNNASHIANINPFRYRSYYYDKETKLYYLNSRYYNPLWGRFLNPDTLLNANQDILSYNLYLYCSNNPIVNTDSHGKGILSSIVKKVKKAVKKVTKVVKTVVKTVVSTVKSFVSSISKPSSKPKKSSSSGSSSSAVCSIKKVNPKTSSLPDYTEELDKVLNRNVNYLKTMGMTNGTAAIYNFYINVKDHGGPWDYKTEKSWEKDISVPYLGQQTEFIWRGYVITAEDFGNINYMFTGLAVGFSPEILYMGAGYKNQGGFTSEVFKGPYYGDNPNDFCISQLGAKEYDK